MINLLPDSLKKQLRAAQINTLLARYIFMTLVTAVALASILYSPYFILSETKENAENLIATNDTKAGIYAETEERVSVLNDSLSSTKATLDDEVLFSEILLGIGKIMPEGTILESLDLKSSTVTVPQQITAYGTTTEALLSLQSAFSSSPLFTQVSFESINQSGGNIADYPVSVTMTVTLNKNVGK